MKPRKRAPMRRTVRLATSAVLALALATTVAASPALEVRLGSHAFDWTTVEDGRAHFAWSADVVNDTRDAVVVQVSVDLLDDDDAVVHSDSAEISVQAGATATAQHAGSLSFDAAAGVVFFRFRLQPRPAR